MGEKTDLKSDLSWLLQIINIYMELFKSRSCKTTLRSYNQHIKCAHGDRDIHGAGERKREGERGRKRERKEERGERKEERGERSREREREGEIF